MTEQSVYAIRSEQGPIKIGIASDPAKRLTQLQNGNPSNLALIGYTDPFCEWSARLHEKLCHAYCAQYRIRGEWFLPGPRVIALSYLLEEWGQVITLICGEFDSECLPDESVARIKHIENWANFWIAESLGQHINIYKDKVNWVDYDAVMASKPWMHHEKFPTVRGDRYGEQSLC